MRRERRNQRAFSAKWALASAVGSLALLQQAMGGAPGAVENFDIKPIDWKGLDNGGGAGEWGPYGYSATNNTFNATGSWNGSGEAGGTFLRGNERSYYADRQLY